MSSHSRSSSELYTFPYSDILPKFYREFKDDFDFNDVKDYFQELFTKEEYQSIVNECNEDRQILRLFWILCSKEDRIPTFLKYIKDDYDWLSNAVINERNNPRKRTEQYVDYVQKLRSSYPKHTDFNVPRMELYIKLRDELRRLTPNHSVVLQGDLGIGKKWLARHVCYDYAVMKAMNFQIYWLDVSDCTSPEQDIQRLQTLLLMLGGTSASYSPTFHTAGNGSSSSKRQEYNDESISNRKFELQQRLRKQLRSDEHKNCLIILKDVRNMKTFHTFNLGVKLLIITRNRKICESLSPRTNRTITIDMGLTLTEVYALFEKYLGQKRDKLPKEVADIYGLSQGHPYLLSIVAQNLRENQCDWAQWLRNLQKLKISDDKLTKVVGYSLDQLSTEHKKLYATFAIFPDSIPIPIRLLAALWDKTLHEAKQIVKRFNQFSFVSKETVTTIGFAAAAAGVTTTPTVIDVNDDDDDNDDGELNGNSISTSSCTLPLVYSSYLRENEGMRKMIDSVALHWKVVDYYKIEQAFRERTEIDFCTDQHDLYFFTCIGYHLHAAGQHELFALIFLDFGFLEQKMRIVGLSNTISDLKFFENEIIRYDQPKRELLLALREFLPKIEEKLTESQDTSLLQYALMASGAIYEEAARLIRKFPHKVWFVERGNFHKRRQIVNLAQQAKLLRFLDQEICLIVLNDNNMLLLDIALDCNKEPVLLLNDACNSRNDAIIEVRLFRENRFVIALDAGGALKIWSIADERRRPSILHRGSSKQKVNRLSLNAGKKYGGKKYKQRIQENSLGQHGVIVAFHIEQLPKKYHDETNLHVAFSNGDICVYKWNTLRDEFQGEKIPILQTHSTDIRFLSKILDKYYMLLSKSGSIDFWNLQDSSKTFVPFDWPKQMTGSISAELYHSIRCDFKEYTRAIFVFSDKVYSLKFEHKEFTPSPLAEVEILYEIPLDTKSSLTCAKLCNDDDQRYLVLGTKLGIILYDTKAKSEVLRSNVSESISCIDIYPLDDEVFKYVIICGSEQRKVLNIFAVRTNGENGITWAHNVANISNEVSSDPQLEAGVWWLGQKLYDIQYRDNGGTLLIAADSKNRVHQVNTTETKSWSISMPKETSESITAITTGKELAFIAYKNGTIFNMSSELFEDEPMAGAINYLQLFDDCHLIASTAKETSIRNVSMGKTVIKNYKFTTKLCYKVLEHYLLLVDESGMILLLDTQDDYALKLQSHAVPQMEKISSCDYQNGCLCLATTSCNIYIYQLFVDQATNMPNIRFCYTGTTIMHHHQPTQNSRITCVALSRDGSLLIAVGLHCGDINIYKYNDKTMAFLYRLESHRKPVTDMKFSLDNDVLVSCAEQLCFWSVPYILNNQLTAQTPKRHSSRFSSQRSATDVEEVDAKVVVNKQYLSVKPAGAGAGDSNGNIMLHNTHNGNGNDDGATNAGTLSNAMAQMQIYESSNMLRAWHGKQGSADKPELLACIKFDGNKAEKFFANDDFTQFNTIDNEGVYYHLALLNVKEESPKVELPASNGIHSVAAIRDVVDESTEDPTWPVNIDTTNNNDNNGNIFHIDEPPPGNDDVYI